MKTKRVLLVVVPVLVLLAALAVWLYLRARGDGVKAAEEATEKATGVVLIPVEYKEGRWVAGERGVRILPCEPPTYYLSGGATEPRARSIEQCDTPQPEKRSKDSPGLTPQPPGHQVAVKVGREPEKKRVRRPRTGSALDRAHRKTPPSDPVEGQEGLRPKRWDGGVQGSRLDGGSKRTSPAQGLAPKRWDG